MHQVFLMKEKDYQGAQENKDCHLKTFVLKLLNYKDKVKIFRNVNKLKISSNSRLYVSK